MTYMMHASYMASSAASTPWTKGSPSSPHRLALNSTTVIAAEVHKELTSGERWSKVGKGELAAVRQLILDLAREKSMTVLDVFRCNASGDVIRAVVRIKSAQLPAWLTLDLESGCTFKPLGEDSDAFGVVWQKAAKPKAQYEAFCRQPGFAGIIVKNDAVGIRVKKDSLEQLREALGISGTSWTVSGVPTALDSDELLALLKLTGWHVELATSRRVYRGTAHWRVRAKDPPHLAILPVQHQGECYGVAVTRSATQNATSASMRSHRRTRSENGRAPTRSPSAARGASPRPRTSCAQAAAAAATKKPAVDGNGLRPAQVPLIPLPPQLPPPPPPPRPVDPPTREESAEKRRKMEENTVSGKTEAGMEGRLAALEQKMGELVLIPQQMATISQSLSGLANMVQSMQASWQRSEQQQAMQAHQMQQQQQQQQQQHAVMEQHHLQQQQQEQERQRLQDNQSLQQEEAQLPSEAQSKEDAQMGVEGDVAAANGSGEKQA